MTKPKLEDFPHPQGGYSNLSFHNALIVWQEGEIAQLRGNLGLAEEGLANYALEVERRDQQLKESVDHEAAYQRDLARLRACWAEALEAVTAGNQEIERLTRDMAALQSQWDDMQQGFVEVFGEPVQDAIELLGATERLRSAHEPKEITVTTTCHHFVISRCEAADGRVYWACEACPQQFVAAPAPAHEPSDGWCMCGECDQRFPNSQALHDHKCPSEQLPASEAASFKQPEGHEGECEQLYRLVPLCLDEPPVKSDGGHRG